MAITEDGVLIAVNVGSTFRWKMLVDLFLCQRWMQVRGFFLSLILIFCDVPLKLDGYFQQIYNAISICEILSVVFRFS